MSRFCPKSRTDPNLDQDRLHLSATDACRYKRVFGLVAHMKAEAASAGTTTPASFQIILKLFWWAATNARWEHGYFRTTAYSAGYAPIRADGASTHVCLGAAICGIVERPHSTRASTSLIAWDHASISEWEFYAPYTLFTPLQREALLDQELMADLPQLGGDHYAIRNRFHFAPSLLIAQPTVPADVLRAVSANNGTLNAVAEHVRVNREPPALAPDHAPAPAQDLLGLEVPAPAPAPALIPPCLPPPNMAPPRWKAPPYLHGPLVIRDLPAAPTTPKPRPPLAPPTLRVVACNPIPEEDSVLDCVISNFFNSLLRSRCPRRGN